MNSKRNKGKVYKIIFFSMFSEILFLFQWKSRVECLFSIIIMFKYESIFYLFLWEILKRV